MTREKIDKIPIFQQSMKNASEYQPDLMQESDDKNAVKWAERIINQSKRKDALVFGTNGSS